MREGKIIVKKNNFYDDDFYFYRKSNITCETIFRINICMLEVLSKFIVRLSLIHRGCWELLICGYIKTINCKTYS